MLSEIIFTLGDDNLTVEFIVGSLVDKEYVLTQCLPCGDPRGLMEAHILCGILLSHSLEYQVTSDWRNALFVLVTDIRRSVAHAKDKKIPLKHNPSWQTMFRAYIIYHLKMEIASAFPALIRDKCSELKIISNINPDPWAFAHPLFYCNVKVLI